MNHLILLVFRQTRQRYQNRKLIYPAYLVLPNKTAQVPEAYLSAASRTNSNVRSRKVHVSSVVYRANSVLVYLLNILLNVDPFPLVRGDYSVLILVGQAFRVIR